MDAQVKMNPEAKAKIVEALRSKKYAQGNNGYLKKNGCFCVWGVICDVSDIASWDIAGDGGKIGYDGEFFRPSEKVQKWLGVDDGVEVVIDGSAGSLMGHNDAGATFAQLADAIEAQL